ncbi:MAG: hypothetical protein WC975_04465 [Phycisphaerae bacterium]
MPGIKLCIFGGGSSYTHHMLNTFAKHVISGDLAGSRISLYDIDRENTDLMASFGSSVARAKKLDLQVERAQTLEQGLEGANFVLSSFRVGGLDQRYLDETIPLKYGILGQETTGVGGLFMICRNAPAAEKLARTMDQVCPEAFLINYTNPTGMISDLSRRVSAVKTFGLCDGVVAVKALMGRLLGLSWQEAMTIEAGVAGVNHCTWALTLRYQGTDLYPRVPELISKIDLAAMETENYSFADAIRLYNYYGLLPGSLSYTGYYYCLRKRIKMFSDPGYEYRSQYLKKDAQAIRAHCRSQIGKLDADFLPYDPEHAAHGDQAIGTIQGLACDTRRMEIVNVKNNGIISNLPEDAVVEVPAILCRQGALPLSMGPLPDSVVGVVQMVHLHCRLAVTAAQRGDRKLVMQAALSHPCNRDLDDMELCVKEMYEKNKDWLPQFRGNS